MSNDRIQGMNRLTIVSPDDMHLHVRDGAALPYVVPHSARQFSRAVIMPNLVPPVTHVTQAVAYRQRILAAVPAGLDFQPLMALYLTETTPVSEVINAASHPDIIGFKLYPAGATTHSEAGVNSLNSIYPLFEAMQEHQVPLLCHGEVTDKNIDVFDRERIFIEKALTPIRQTFPGLRIILEHITTREAVDFILGSNENTAATITAHHLMYNRNAMFNGGIRPHYYCLPLLKRNIHQQALISAAISGNSRFFLGTDSAPHPKSKKEQSCGCAGCYTAHAALALYAGVFEDNNALDKLEGFASIHGAAFYGLQQNRSTVTLVRRPWNCPDQYEFNDDSLIPIAAGEQLNWQIEHT